MNRVEMQQVVKFDEWRWKVSYGMPDYGKDYWGRKADERERAEKDASLTKRKWRALSWRKKQER